MRPISHWFRCVIAFVIAWFITGCVEDSVGAVDTFKNPQTVQTQNEVVNRAAAQNLELQRKEKEQQLAHEDSLFRLNEARQQVELEEQRERTAWNNSVEQVFAPIWNALGVTFALFVISLLVYGGFWGASWLRKQATTIYPDSAGFYPLIKERFRDHLVIVDPNRALNPATVVSLAEAKAITIMQIGSDPATQAKITGHAQVGQAIRAASSGMATLQTSQSLTQQVQSEVLSPALPPVQVFPSGHLTHVEKLLADSDGAL